MTTLIHDTVAADEVLMVEMTYNMTTADINKALINAVMY